MKTQKFSLLSLALAAFLLISNLLSAQQFDWAKSYSGEAPFSETNNIVRTVYDCEGNSYIFGSAGVTAYIDSVLLCPLFGNDRPSNILVKFDPEGNVVWFKTVMNTSRPAKPYWMEMVGDSAITISINSDLAQLYDCMWFIDSMVTFQQIYAIPEEERQFPFQLGYFNAFLTFDLEGNLIDQHYLEIKYRTKYNNNYYYMIRGLSHSVTSPFHIDQDGNFYIYTFFQSDSAYGESAPVEIIVDKEKTFSFTIDNNAYFARHTWHLFKFSPDFDLIWQKALVKDCSVDNIEVTAWPHHFSTDTDDNIYLSGYIALGNGFLPPLPISIYLDTIQQNIISITDTASSYLGQSFLIKLDTSGTVQWCTQMHLENPTPTYCGHSRFHGSSVDNNEEAIFVIGDGETIGVPLTFSDGSILSQYSPENVYRVFFAKFDIQTGKYISHGIVPCDNVSALWDGEFDNPVVINDKVYANSIYHGNLYANDTVYTINRDRQFAFCVWDTAGNFIKTLPLTALGPSMSADPIFCGPLAASPRGELMVTGNYDQRLQLSNIILEQNWLYNAFMAKYSDSSMIATVSLHGNDSLCVGDNTVLTAKGGARFLWSTGAESRSITVAPTETTTYSVTVFTANYCEVGTANITVTVLPLQELSIAGNTSICQGESTVLTAIFGSVLPSSLKWNTGSTLQSITVSPTETTLYSVTIISANGCESVANIWVIVHPTYSDTIQASVCEGANYSYCDQTLSESGFYPCMQSSVFGCDSISTLQLSVLPNPTITISGDTVISLGNSTTLTAETEPLQSMDYLWNTGITTPVIIVSPTVNTSYSVRGTDMAGCFGYDSITVNVTLSVNELPETNLLQLIPNPTNSQTLVSGIEAHMIDLLQVINLQGIVVFESRQNNRIVLDGFSTGIYIVCIKTFDGEMFYLKLVKQ